MSMDDEDVIRILRAEASSSVGIHEGQLADDVESLNDYYHGKPYGNEVKGRSAFRTREVYEVIESMMPYLIKVFFSSDKACIFDPDDSDDVQAAEQETEYVNWVFYRDNPGFKIGYSWIKDGLMNKVGYVKAVREIQTPDIVELENQTEEQVSLYLEGLGDDFEGDVTVIEQDDGLFTINADEGVETSKTVIINVPPEEIRISDGDKGIQESRYFAQHGKRSISDIRQMGLDIDDDIEDFDDDADISLLRQSRLEDVTTGSDIAPERAGPSREVTLKEEYLYIDKDGDGIDELWQFFRVGDTILSEERVNERQFYSWSPIITPHKHHGNTPADPVMEIQLLKSKITRNLLDNQERMNKGRYAVVDGQVNVDDLLWGNNSGVVRETFAGAVRDLPTPEIGGTAFDVLMYSDTLVEKRTGVSDRGQGLDPRQFNSNTAATTAELVMSAAEQKIELIARIFAETGLKDLMLGIHRLGMKHEKPGKKIRNNNGVFIPIDPHSWHNRYDMSVTVGIGNGSKAQQMMQMREIESTMGAIISGGGMGTLVTPTNVFNLAMEKTRIVGRRDGNLFFTKPESDEVQEGPSVDEQIKLKEVQIKEAELQLTAKELELEAAELEFKKIQHENDNEFKLAELALETRQNRAVKVGNAD